MKHSTGRDIQRAQFVDNLYKQLRQQTASAIADRDRLVVMANNFISDGLSTNESIELMMIEANISREAAESYVEMVNSNEVESEIDSPEWSFCFSDVYGKVWSSNDIGLSVFASNEEDAWEKAENVITSSQMESDRILSVDRMS